MKMCCSSLVFLLYGNTCEQLALFPVAFCSFRKDNSAAFSERIYTKAIQSFEPFGSFEEIKLIWLFEWIGSSQAV